MLLQETYGNCTPEYDLSRVLEGSPAHPFAREVNPTNGNITGVV